MKGCFILLDTRVKDESYRLGLNAFKVIGGIYTVAKYLTKAGGRIENLSFQELKPSRVKEKLGELTFFLLRFSGDPRKKSQSDAGQW